MVPDAHTHSASLLDAALDRRSLLKRGVALGLSAPALAALLAACGGDDADDAVGAASTSTTTSGTAVPSAAAAGTPTSAGEARATATTGDAGTSGSPDAAQAGGGGLLRLLWWQAPTIVNPHLALGGKDTDASRVCYQPLADFDAEGNGVPILAAEMPSLENGGVAADGTSVTWKLRDGVTWHDGEPFTAADVRFTWQYASDPATAATTGSAFATVADVEVVDDHTVVVHFSQPSPGWLEVFTGPNGMILPEHVFADFVGEAARDAPANLAPVGTGPFKVVEFRPGDTVRYARYEGYWDAGKPFFDEVEMKGGGDSPGAARAVLETGEADWAWNVQVEPAILDEMARAGAGVVVANPGSNSERLVLNHADPNTEIDGARAEPSTKHPIFQHLAARQAIGLAVPRDVIATQLYGAGGVATANVLNAPAMFVSPNTSWTFDLEQAQAKLEEAGVSGGTLLYQTTINSVRQKTQEIIKQSLEQLGFAVELKSIEAAVFFSPDAGNPDTFTHFYADLEMYTDGPASPYPVTWMDQWRSDTVASKANSWSGTNLIRYQNPEYDALHDQARTELDPAKQVELLIALNDIVVNDVAEVPLVHRAGVAAASTRLQGYVGTPWASDVWSIADWYAEG